MTELSVATAGRATRANSSVLRWVVIVFGVAFLALGIVDFSGHDRAGVAGESWPIDFDINWVAAQRLVDHQPIYDRAASRAEGVAMIGPQMLRTSHGPYSSYIGSPPIALTHVPFLAFDHDTAAHLFRLFSLLEMIAALLLTAWALAPPARLPAALIALGAMFWGFPMVKSVALGQGGGLVMLGLAVGVWAASRERWGLAGVGLGVAAVLKISPVLLIVYLLLRGKRRAVWSSILTAAACFGAAALVGRPNDLVVWLRDVAPEVSKGTMRVYNQSIVGAMSRLTTGAIDLSTARSVGAWYLLAYALWAIALFGLWRWRRHRPLDLLELGVLIVVVVLAGPLSWDHYSVYALVPFVLMADYTRWVRLRPPEIAGLLIVVATALAMFHHSVQVPDPDAVAAQWSLRFLTDRYAMCLILFLIVGVWLLARSPVPDAGESDDGRSEWTDDGATAVGATLPLVAGRVHERGGS